MLESDVASISTNGELLKGKIKFFSDDTYHILLQGQLVSAQPAFSCLITPLVDDEVLLFKDASNYYILAIIQRYQSTALSIKLGDNLSLVGENNNLKLNAPTISLTADDTINLSASSQNIDCDTGKFSIIHAHFRGEELKFSYQSLKMICQYIQTISDTINTQALRVYHWVNELEHQFLGRLRTIVKHNYRIDCDEMEIHAEGDTKIAAKQIQLG
ncbi:hypothetical protein DGG96_04855 [Legionella qingyii]|uniref:DUF3540 domain-containing protein n=1 Tax=Legionella qingyii TaxID=2184757 RepID=A0A317U8M1_9GAMM|nr:DUF3540 domain-containing protein [Legionella qingyii]PWY56740.1 hypothetical protein DGG96_04855 [Legionella qingyii]RUR23704.1 DUF3540 domain-containing protein [Legionella qingyii]RUR26287.1 DUF3540 domain-containing protein [Legionella qingyii]